MKTIKTLFYSLFGDIFVPYIVIINIIGFFTMLIDKRLAISGKRRISEKTLLIIAAIGGSLGSYAGMYLFRHKTKHKKFTVTVPVFMIAQGALLYYLFLR